VAGIQIATHRLVAHGDWIEMPQYGADGDVMEVGLHTVKVRNFDKTITTIPTYKLISDSFKNWRGMTKSDGRRIKRAMLININSIAFVKPEQVSELLTVLDNPAFNEFVGDIKVEQTNIGLFRRYCEFYMSINPKVNQDMTLMARQLAPSEHGIAIELYCFCLDKSWPPYEKVQAELVEHLLARMPTFGLKAYQTR
jgi:miniconductance mechanosensitive channel